MPVIVGAGPIGLYLAIKLNRLKIKELLVIDPRANQYTRPGAVDFSIFSEIAKNLNHPIIHSPSRHIKEIERQLILIAEKEGVKIENSEFMTFKDGKLEVKNSANQIETIATDLVVDATGEKRAVINEVNRLEKKNIFPIESIGDNPLKNHFIAYVKMRSDDINLLEQRNTDKIMHVKMLERLRHEFSWQKFSPPYFEIRPLEKNKVCFYYEIPESLPKEKEEDWLRVVLEMLTGHKLNFTKLQASKKYKNKPRFTRFVVDPQKVTKAFYLNENFPFIAVVGDALINLGYQSGFSIAVGIKIIEALLDSLIIKNDIIMGVDTEKYQNAIDELIKEQQKDVEQLYQNRKNQLIEFLYAEKEMYQEVLKLQHDPKIQKALAEIETRIRINDKVEKNMQLHDEMIVTYTECLNENFEIPVTNFSVHTLSKTLITFTRIYDELKSLNVPEVELVELSLLHMANNFSLLADKLLVRENYKDSRSYYELAKDLYKTYFSGDYPEKENELAVKLENLENLEKAANTKKFTP